MPSEVPHVKSPTSCRAHWPQGVTRRPDDVCGSPGPQAAECWMGCWTARRNRGGYSEGAVFLRVDAGVRLCQRAGA